MKRFALTALLIAALSPSAHAATSLTLNEAIAKALATHPDALIADNREEAAELAVADAQSQRFTLSTDVSALSRTSQAGLLGQGPLPQTTNQQSINGNVSLTVPLFTGFKLTNAVASAQHQRDAASSSRRQTRQELTIQVTRAFWQLRQAELVEEIQQEAIAQTERTLKLTRAGYALGRQTTSDVDRVEVSVLNAKNEQLRLQGETLQARTELATLVGTSADSLSIDGASVTLTTAIALPSRERVERLLDQRPDVQAAAARLQAAEASLAAAGGDRWPQLSLITTYQHGNNPYDPTLGARGFSSSVSGTWDARLAASFNLFDGGKIHRAIARAEGEVREARATHEKARRDARLQAEKALIRLKSARDRLELTDKSTAIAGKTLKWVETRYQQGYASQVEVNDSLGSLVTSRTQRVQALIDAQLARAELERALGTL
ncbi:TolC family protein [bacterium]|nr:TolC family protein [bacterium]